MIDSGTGWAAAVGELTVLPGALAGPHGVDNFLRSVRYRRNSRRLFDEGIAPLVSGGDSYEVVLGFVDRAFADEGPIAEGGGLLPGTTEFLAARLRHCGSGRIVEVSLAAT
jgi:hypothetical protein